MRHTRWGDLAQQTVVSCIGRVCADQCISCVTAAAAPPGSFARLQHCPGANLKLLLLYKGPAGLTPLCLLLLLLYRVCTPQTRLVWASESGMTPAAGTQTAPEAAPYTGSQR
jgi:hypothetical protein